MGQQRPQIAKKTVGCTPKMQRPEAAPCSATLQAAPATKFQSANSTLTAAPSGTSNQTPERKRATLIFEAETVETAPCRHPAAAPCSGTSMPARKCTRLWQQHSTLQRHPAAAPACPLQSGHTTLTAPASSTLQRHQHARSKTQTCNSLIFELRTLIASLFGENVLNSYCEYLWILQPIQSIHGNFPWQPLTFPQGMPCNLAIADTARCIARRATRASAPPMPTVEELDDMYPATGAVAGLAYV